MDGHGLDDTWDVCMGKLMLLSIIVYALFVYHLFWVFSPSIQWCLGCDQTFQFTPYAPQHNHPNDPHLEKGYTIGVLTIHKMPWLHVWERSFQTPSSIHNANRTFFENF
jgi:hypothetical protein